MNLSEIVILFYSLLTVAVVFLAGRSSAPNAKISAPGRSLGLVFAAAEVLTLAAHVATVYDLHLRSFYMVFNAALGCVGVASWGLVAYALRGRKLRWWWLLVPWGLVSVGVVLGTALDRTAVWPPFALLSMALLGSPVLALAPRFRVRGYRPFRDKEFVPWVALGGVGLLAVVETWSMVGARPGVRYYGLASLLHVFLAGTVVLGLLVRPEETRPAGPAPAIPWQLFNPPLSPREADLIDGLRRRLTNKELAAELGVGESTVKKHLAQVYQKAGVESRQQLIEKLG